MRSHARGGHVGNEELVGDRATVAPSTARVSPELMATVSSSGSPVNRIVSTSSIHNAVIDNEDFAYYVAFDTTSPNEFSHSLGLWAVRFGYAVTSPLP